MCFWTYFAISLYKGVMLNNKKHTWQQQLSGRYINSNFFFVSRMNKGSRPWRSSPRKKNLSLLYSLKLGCSTGCATCFLQRRQWPPKPPWYTFETGDNSSNKWCDKKRRPQLHKKCIFNPEKNTVFGCKSCRKKVVPYKWFKATFSRRITGYHQSMLSYYFLYQSHGFAMQHQLHYVPNFYAILWYMA